MTVATWRDVGHVEDLESVRTARRVEVFAAQCEVEHLPPIVHGWRDRTFSPNIEYSFFTDKHKSSFKGSRIISKQKLRRKNIKEVIAVLPTDRSGKELIVYYNPKNPHENAVIVTFPD